jgi:PAS domain S-box-containing protein
VWALIDPAEHDALSTARGREDSLHDWRLKRRDGSYVSVEIASRRLSDGRRVGVARDVSARRQAEQAERRALTAEAVEQRTRAADAERRLQRFWDASRDLFAIVAASDGVPRLINERAWEATLGYPAPEILSTRLVDLVHPDDRGRTMGMRAANPGDIAYFGFENRYLRRDGEIVWLSWNVVREDGLIYCSARDISEEKRAQEALARANARLAQAQKMEAIGQLTGGVAHDFNNLLMVMGGHAELLRARLSDDARAERSLEAISEAARRGQALTRHLLAFSRRQRLKPTPISLVVRIGQLQPLLASSLGAAIELEIVCQADLWTVEVDVGEWDAAILNMAVNARDAMPRGGRLTISARNVTIGAGDAEDPPAGEFVELTVADTGEGIPGDILPKVVDPFFTTKEINKGTGLGLSQVDGFVTQSGGRLAIESTLGQGTTIRILLPRVAAAPVHRDDPSAPATHRRLRVLCVEDNPEVADVTAGLLEQLGHDVELVSSAAAALTRLEEGVVPDLLFSDIVMAGDMNGLGLARRVRQRWPATPVLLATGYSREAEAIGHEFPVLAKPYELADLARALQAAAEAAALAG